MYLRFERIDAGRGPMPLVASVTGVPGERKVKDSTTDKGDVRSTGGHLILERGARLELQMDRPLVIER